MPQCCRIAYRESIARQRTEVKLEFTGGFVPEVPDPDDHDDTVQARPLGLFIKSIWSMQTTQTYKLPGDDGLLRPVGHSCVQSLKTNRLCRIKPGFHQPIRSRLALRLKI